MGRGAAPGRRILDLSVDVPVDRDRTERASAGRAPGLGGTSRHQRDRGSADRRKRKHRPSHALPFISSRAGDRDGSVIGAAADVPSSSASLLDRTSFSSGDIGPHNSIHRETRRTPLQETQAYSAELNAERPVGIPEGATDGAKREQSFRACAGNGVRAPREPLVTYGCPDLPTQSRWSACERAAVSTTCTRPGQLQRAPQVPRALQPRRSLRGHPTSCHVPPRLRPRRGLRK
jgi:hypothetical protein